MTNVVRMAADACGERWQARLGDRAVLGARVTEVREHPATAEVRYVRDGHAGRLFARHVILAVPASLASALLPGAPPAIADELRAVAYGPFVCRGSWLRPASARCPGMTYTRS